jgi:hypothetical protein
MVLYPESVNFILFHDSTVSQSDLPFNQEFPLGVTFYILRGQTDIQPICFYPVVTFEIWPYSFFFFSQQYQHGGRKNISVGAVVQFVMWY